MEHLLTIDSLISLVTLAFLEIVLGIDNVIFVSILMGRLPDNKKLSARRIWMIAGITARILLLLALGWLVKNGSRELFGLDLGEKHVGFNLRNIIMFVADCSSFTKQSKRSMQNWKGMKSQEWVVIIIM